MSSTKVAHRERIPMLIFFHTAPIRTRMSRTRETVWGRVKNLSKVSVEEGEGRSGPVARTREEFSRFDARRRMPDSSWGTMGGEAQVTVSAETLRLGMH